MFRQHITLSLAPEARVDVETDPLRAMQLSPQQYELILLDTVIGNMDCFQWMTVMKKQAPQVRFVIVSEEANEFYRFQAYHNGADLFLLRPQSQEAWEEVLGQLRQLLEPATVPLASAQAGDVSTLSELVALRCQQADSSMIQVDIIGNSGDIFIYEGTVYHAQCSGYSGERAFVEMLAWPAEQMRIKVYKLNYTPPRTIERNLSELLLGNAEVAVLDLPVVSEKAFAVTPPDVPESPLLPEEMATLEAPPKDTRSLEPVLEKQPAPNCDISFRSPALISHWKIDLMGKFDDGCGAIDPTHTAALTYFIYRKMADIAVALDEDYFNRLTLIGPQYRQELVADNLGVRHALFHAPQVTPGETDNFITWCYGHGQNV